MTQIARFVALPFDFVDGGLVAGTPVDCAGPAAAIRTAQGQWKVLGQVGAVAYSRSSNFSEGTLSLTRLRSSLKPRF